MFRNIISVFVLLAAALPFAASAQNVGVDVAAPQQKLDVAGGIRIGTTSAGLAGSLRWDSGQLQVHDGTSWVSLGANTDSQQFDVVQLTGTNLELSLQNDGVGTHVIDLSPLADNTDDQTIDLIQLTGNTLELSLEDDGQVPQTVDLSALANTDNQTIDLLNITSNNLTISLEDDGLAPLTVDLSPYLDNTDNQTLDLYQLNGNNLEISLEDDGQAPQVVDLSVFADNTDDQTFDIVQLTGNTLELSLENDGQATHTIDLSGFADNTDDQTIDAFSLSGTNLNLSLEDDGQATQIVDLGPLKRSLVDGDGDTRVEVEANPDEDRIRFTTATAERMIIMNDGKVGVGTTAPDNQLTVAGSPSTAYPALGINSGNDQATFNNGAQIAFGYNNTDEYQHFIHTRHNQLAAANNSIDFYVNDGSGANNSVTSGSTHVMSMNAGNVGIGTTSPIAGLHVQTSGNPTAVLRNTTNAGGAAIQFSDNTGFAQRGTLTYRHSDTQSFGFGNSFHLAGTEASMMFRVEGHGSYEGRVGIGTTAPAQELHVVGDIRSSALAGTGTRSVYATANGDLTTTGPTSGAAGYWTRTGTVLRPTNVGDEVDMGDQTIFMRDDSGNTFGMGFATEGGSELTVFTDNLLDFTESDNNTIVMRIEGNSGRVEIPGTNDASGTAGSGVLEIGNALRIDNNEIITNTNAILFINSDNNGDVQMDGGTFHLDASTNRVGIGTATPAYDLETRADGTISVNDGYVREVRGLYMMDWDDNTGGNDNKYRLLARDGAWQFYDGGVVVGNYGDGTWSDLSDGYLIVENRVGVNTTAPTRQLDVNGTVRIRGGGPATGAYLQAQNANGDATWSRSGYGLVPLGTIVAWHKSGGSVGGLPAGWRECNGGAAVNGINIPDLNNTYGAEGGGSHRGRFLRGGTSSGSYQSDRTNNFYRWEQDDDDGGPNRWEANLSQSGGWNGHMGSYHSNDRRRFRLKGGETRPMNMSVVWIIRVE